MSSSGAVCLTRRGAKIAAYASYREPSCRAAQGGLVHAETHQAAMEGGFGRQGRKRSMALYLLHLGSIDGAGAVVSDGCSTAHLRSPALGTVP
jgi:hypothetical protein